MNPTPHAGQRVVHAGAPVGQGRGVVILVHGRGGSPESIIIPAEGLGLPDLTYLPGWARTVETTPDRRFLVVASVTDPLARTHRRGVAEGATPVEGAVRATLAALNRTISRDL